MQGAPKSPHGAGSPNERTATQSLTDTFLLATPMHGPSDLFAEAVVYVMKHDAGGAVGMVVNKPIAPRVADIIDVTGSQPLPRALAEAELLRGGTAYQTLLWALYPSSGGSGNAFANDTYAMAVDSEELARLAQGTLVADAVGVGLLTWQAGALDRELQREAWLLVPAGRHLFQVPARGRCALARSSIWPKDC